MRSTPTRANPNQSERKRINHTEHREFKFDISNLYSTVVLCALCASLLASMRLIFAGSGEFGVPTLVALLEAGHEIALVVSQPDRPAGRGRHLTPTAISRLALDHQCPLLRTADINQEQLPPADLMVVIAFGQKIAPHIVPHARLGSVNLHGSRLPRFRGAAPVNAAILAGESVTGNS